MSFTMQNYNKYFNVASDIFIFLTIVYFILKIHVYFGHKKSAEALFLLFVAEDGSYEIAELADLFLAEGGIGFAF